MNQLLQVRDLCTDERRLPVHRVGVNIWQPVGLRMIRIRWQRTGISAAHISPLFPYIFPMCASKSVLALAGY